MLSKLEKASGVDYSLGELLERFFEDLLARKGTVESYKVKLLDEFYNFVDTT